MEKKKTDKPQGKACKFLKNKIVLNLLLAILLCFILLLGSYWFFHAITGHGKELDVPDLSFMTVPDATKVLEHEGLNIVVLDSLYIHSLPRGVVYQQDPVAGSHVKKGRKIRVVINSVQPKRVDMPDLVGYSLRQAKDVLEARGLVLGQLIYVDDIATNNVLHQKFKGVEVLPGSRVESESVIDLVLGLDPADNSTYIPDVIGLPRTSAADAVIANSLNLGRLYFDSTVQTYTDSLNAVVYRQSPSASDIPVSYGTAVSLHMTLDTTKIPSEILPTEK